MSSDSEIIKAHQTNMNYIYDVCEKELFAFVKWAWQIIEPGKPFRSNWHIEAICQSLEDMYYGRLKNKYGDPVRKIIIEVPPRTTKSSVVSVIFPAWVWAKDASRQILSISNIEDLSVRMAIGTKKIIESDWFKARWGSKTELAKDQNTKSYYKNVSNGSREAIGITSKITGKGGDLIIIDDPQDANKTGAESEAELKQVTHAYNNAITTRENDPTKSNIIVIMQRLHELDLVGYLKEEETADWKVLTFPMEYDEEIACAEDTRTVPGQLLWPERFNATWVEKAKKRLGIHGYSAQCGQRPQPKGGSLIPIDDFQYYEELPKIEPTIVAQFWDTASNSKQINDYWVGMTIAVIQGNFYIIDLIRKQMKYPEGKNYVKTYFLTHNPSAVVIENKGTGQSLIQDIPLDDDCYSVPIVSFEPNKHKVSRMDNETISISGKKVFIPKNAAWKHEFLKECQRFPQVKHDDQVDALSMGLNYLRLRGARRLHFSVIKAA